MNKHLEQLNEIDDLGGPDIRGFQHDNRRFKGGKKGGDPAAFAREQEAKKEAQRQAFYKGTGYNDPSQQAARESQYSGMESDLTAFHRTQLDRERDEAMRQMRFNNSRAGLSNSSQSSFDQGTLDESYQRGLADIAARAKNAVSQAKGGYETAFNRGLQQINAGGDAGTQISSTLSDYANAISSALEGAKGGSWGGFFGDIASTTDTAKVNAGQASVGKNGLAIDPAVAKLGQSQGASAGSGRYINQ
jgi:hypothetical protein